MPEQAETNGISYSISAQLCPESQGYSQGREATLLSDTIPVLEIPKWKVEASITRLQSNNKELSSFLICHIPPGEGKNQLHPSTGFTVPFLRLLPGFHLFTGENSDGAQDEGSWLLQLLTPWTTYSPRYFCPLSLRTKLAVRLQEAEKTAESVQAWVANMGKTRQRLQKVVEDLTVDLEKARNPAIQECI